MKYPIPISSYLLRQLIIVLFADHNIIIAFNYYSILEMFLRILLNLVIAHFLSARKNMKGLCQL